jgi:phage tail sheath gpL-like
MSISFSRFPANWRMPLHWIEVDPSKAGLPTFNQPALLVGTKNTAAPAPANIPILVSTVEQARSYFGDGSMLALMFTAFFANNFAHQVYGLPIAEPAGGTAATGTITVTGPATAAGTIALYVAGQLIQVAVAAADTANTIAASINTAINLVTTLPVTSTVATNVVTMTCKWKGTTGNDIDVRDTYAGTLGGQVMPAGVSLAYSGSGKLTTGAGTPTVTTAIANLGDFGYEYVAWPYTDSTNLAAIETEYGFGDTGRWGWMRQLYGHVFSAYRDTYANLVTFGQTRNAPVTSIMAMEVNMPSSVWEVTAAYTAMAARALLNDPARPLQTLTLSGILPAPVYQNFLLTELNTMAGNGLATQNTNAAGVPAIMRDTTTYRLNLYNQPDDAYEVVTTLATLARIFRNQRAAITSKFPRHKLADDGTRFGGGQAIVTPKIIKAELVAQYRVDELNGLVENADAFKKNLIVERDPNNPNRLNVLYPPDLVNQLRIFAVLAQFRLQFDRGVDTTISA